MIADQITIRKRIFQFIRLARWEVMKLITIIVRFYWDYQKEVFYCFSEKKLGY